MKSLERAGGFSALYCCAAYLAAMPFFLLVVDLEAVREPIEKVRQLAVHGAGIYAMELVVYVFFGIFLSVLAVALGERLKAGAEGLCKVATPVALIWSGLLIASGMIYNVGMLAVTGGGAGSPAQAAALWSAVDTVSAGLSGNGEIVGGTWMLLVSLAGFKSGRLPKALNVLGALVAAIGILSVMPPLKEAAYVFGAGQIPWFAWLGIVLLRGDRVRMEGAA